MEIKEILKTVDHTLLLPASTWISHLYRYRIPKRL